MHYWQKIHTGFDQEMRLISPKLHYAIKSCLTTLYVLELKRMSIQSITGHHHVVDKSESEYEASQRIV